MNRSEITAVTLLMLHAWTTECLCSWYSPSEGVCSRCYALKRAQEDLPLIYEAFMNTITTMENTK
jgi:hypothetical protein